MFALLFLLSPILISLNAINPTSPAHTSRSGQGRQRREQQQRLSNSPEREEMAPRAPATKTDGPPADPGPASCDTCAETTPEGTKVRHDSVAVQQQDSEARPAKQTEPGTATEDGQVAEDKRQEADAGSAVVEGVEEKEEGEEDEQRRTKALSQKQRALAQREQQLADLQQDISWKAAAAKEEDLEELGRKRAALRKRERVLFATETAQKEVAGRLDDREEELARREAELQRRLGEVDAKERAVAAREAAAAAAARRDRRDADRANSDFATEAHGSGLVELAGADENADASSVHGAKQTVVEKEALKRQVQHLQKRVAGVLKSSTSADARDVSRLRSENARLKDHIVTKSLQEARLSGSKAEVERLKTDNVRLRTQRDGWKKQAHAARPAKEVPGAPRHDGAKRYDCGHVIYPAPRKISKKCKNFVGFMYED